MMSYILSYIDSEYTTCATIKNGRLGGLKLPQMARLNMYCAEPAIERSEIISSLQLCETATYQFFGLPRIGIGS
jgi:hypothetical protein